MFTEYHASSPAAKSGNSSPSRAPPVPLLRLTAKKALTPLSQISQLKVLARQAGYYRRDKTLPVAEDLLQRHADVQGIIGWNDEVAMGALAAVKSQNRKGIAITGGDGNRDTCEAILKAKSMRA